MDIELGNTHERFPEHLRMVTATAKYVDEDKEEEDKKGRANI